MNDPVLEGFVIGVSGLGLGLLSRWIVERRSCRHAWGAWGPAYCVEFGDDGDSDGDVGKVDFQRRTCTKCGETRVRKIGWTAEDQIVTTVTDKPTDSEIRSDRQRRSNKDAPGGPEDAKEPENDHAKTSKQGVAPMDRGHLRA